MVNRRTTRWQKGQGTAEYILMLGILTLLGLALLVNMTGSGTKSNGAILNMSSSATKNIAADER
jgi:hypothetical protein